jgi:uncharacterized protein (DUF4415 family)
LGNYYGNTHQTGQVNRTSPFRNTGRPRHPEYFKPIKKAVQICLDADVLAWFKGYGKGYQSRITAVLREVMLRTVQRQAEDKTGSTRVAE